jgi:mRNA-degrading endonuclease toxin of MazEF toxin-antitoxin module
MNPQPGEIWLADLGLAAKTRPVVIVSRQDPDPPRALVLYVPLTTQRRNSPYEVPLPRLPNERLATPAIRRCRATWLYCRLMRPISARYPAGLSLRVSAIILASRLAS